MQHYSRIPIWENNRRLGVLTEFRRQLVVYFPHAEGKENSGASDDVSLHAQARQGLNLLLADVSRIVDSTGVPSTMVWTPPAIAGGQAQIIALLPNIFNLTRYRISSRDLVDVLDRAIGVYEADRSRALRRSLNPFYWIGIFLESAAQLPFTALGRAGFDQVRIESSVAGRLLKGLVFTVGGLATFLASVLTILQLLGMLEPIAVLFGRTPSLE